MNDRGTRRFLLLLAVLLVALLVVKGRLRRLRLDESDPSRTLAGVFTPGEQVAAALLGGFRSILLNVLWVRIQSRVEDREFLELPFLLKAVEELQGISPMVFQMQARMMCLDIPVVIRGEQARWSWIRRGLGVLERGLERFPRDVQMLEEAGFIYFVRFHPRTGAADRERFLGDAELNPDGTDPFWIASDLLERALENPEHSVKVDRLFWLVQTVRAGVLLDVDLEKLRDPSTVAAARARLADPDLARAMNALLDRSLRHLEHVESDHMARAESERVQRIFQGWIELGRAQIATFRETLLD